MWKVLGQSPLAQVCVWVVGGDRSEGSFPARVISQRGGHGPVGPGEAPKGPADLSPEQEAGKWNVCELLVPDGCGLGLEEFLLESVCRASSEPRVSVVGRVIPE